MQGSMVLVHMPSLYSIDIKHVEISPVIYIRFSVYISFRIEGIIHTHIYTDIQTCTDGHTHTHTRMHVHICTQTHNYADVYMRART